MAKAKPELTSADYAKLLTPLLAGTPMPAFAGTAKKPSPGVFANGKVSDPLRQKVLDDGYVESHLRSETDTSGKKPKTVTVEDLKLTQKGKDFVLRELGGRELLEPLPEMVRATATAIRAQMSHLESKIAGLYDLIGEIAAMHAKLAESATESIAGLQQVISHAAGRQVTVKIEAIGGGAGPDIDKPLLEYVRQWHDAHGNYCPFDKLYPHLHASFPTLTIGHFHDALRRLHTDKIVRSSAWTQIIDEIPMPELVFMISSRPMYYAHVPN